jgi:hypothetical protein
MEVQSALGCTTIMYATLSDSTQMREATNTPFTGGGCTTFQADFPTGADFTATKTGYGALRARNR